VLSRFAAIVVLALVTFGAGYALGHRAALGQTMPLLAADTQFNLAQRIESLAKLRLGDVTGAVADLEMFADGAALNLLQGRSWADLEPGVQRSIQLAKAYRSKFPPTNNDTLVASLLPVPVLDAQSCSPALRVLLEQSTGGASRPREP